MPIQEMQYSNPPSDGKFALVLLNWFRENGRDLPWRGTHDAYAIWLSEIILQQTRVQQGRDYWLRFMHRWPTVEQLAVATEDEVLREWQGLGYYSRARNLHFAARQIVEMGGFPCTFETIRSLKGVGDYTAAAIGSMAFDLPVAVVDGNVYRVLARYFGISTPINTTEGKKEFAQLAQALLPPNEAAAYNQAIMDFGAIQCTPQSPHCMLCPLQESCSAYRLNRIAELPVKLKKLKITERRFTYIYIRYAKDANHPVLTAIRRRGEGDIWQGLWEPYLVEEADDAFPSFVKSDSGQLQLISKDFRHVLTHRILYCDFYLWQTTVKPALTVDYQWVDEHELEQYALPRMIELLLQQLTSTNININNK